MPFIAARGISTTASSLSTKFTTSAATNPTNVASLCQTFAPLQGFALAQSWCEYYWPQPLATVTSTIKQQNPTPTTIHPVKATEPATTCTNESELCVLYNELLQVVESQNNKNASAFWYVTR